MGNSQPRSVQRLKEMGKQGDITSLYMEDDGVEGCIDETSDLNTADSCLFPISNRQATLCCAFKIVATIIHEP